MRQLFRAAKDKMDKNRSRNFLPFIKDGRLPFLNDARATKLKSNDFLQDDVIIALIGPTGSGRSTFLEMATGIVAGIGHGLQSTTSKISSVRLSFPELSDYDIVFIDTPGFDDTYVTDTEVFMMISEWLRETYEKRIVLSGLLYFHRISDNRMGASALKNLKMFDALSGGSMENVILITTMWDIVEPDLANQREQELTSEYWSGMLKRGSTTRRFLHSQESAFQVLKPLLDSANRNHANLLDVEMESMRKELGTTSAGRKLLSSMETLMAERARLLACIRKEVDQGNGDKETLQRFKSDYQALKDSRSRILSDVDRLRPYPIGKKLTKIFGLVNA